MDLHVILCADCLYEYGASHVVYYIVDKLQLYVILNGDYKVGFLIF